MPYYDEDETREERDRREERHRTSLKRTAAEHQALTAASGHLIGRLLLIPFKCIVKLTLWSSRYAWQYGWRFAQRLYFTAQPPCADGDCPLDWHPNRTAGRGNGVRSHRVRDRCRRTDNQLRRTLGNPLGVGVSLDT